MLDWVSQFNIFLFLDNQEYQNDRYHGYECLLAVGNHSTALHSIEEVKDILEKKKWYFGHLAYELKNHLHGPGILKENKTGFPDLFFFEPYIIIGINGNQLFIEAAAPGETLEAIHNFQYDSCIFEKVDIQASLTKEEYIEKIKDLQQHIQRGDCYEINFCQEFFSNDARIVPDQVFRALTRISPNPFSAFYRVDDQYLMCASPERFLCKKGAQMISQPIKGTMERDTENSVNDEALKKRLRNSQKEQSENVMIVDLVRNDLSRICTPASVKVEELFGIYSFPQVHQMISTISGTLEASKNFKDILQACFPMGSMTGAPKTKVMELIDTFEPQQRGIFSGSVGYMDPEGNFDLNVVIRSIMYNAATGYLSYQVGSGITILSNPESEWEECLLKAAAIKKVLANEDQHF